MNVGCLIEITLYALLVSGLFILFIQGFKTHFILIFNTLFFRGSITEVGFEMAPRPRNSIKREVDDLSSDCSSDSFKKNTNSKRVDKASEEYCKRRERNNLAVKKSRTKTKQKTQETIQRIKQLREENERLVSSIEILTKELSFLKDLFLAHAGNVHGLNMTVDELSYLRNERKHSALVKNSSNIIEDTKP